MIVRTTHLGSDDATLVLGHLTPQAVPVNVWEEGLTTSFLLLHLRVMKVSVGGHRQDQLFFLSLSPLQSCPVVHIIAFSLRTFFCHEDSRETSGSWGTVTFVDGGAPQFCETESVLDLINGFHVTLSEQLFMKRNLPFFTHLISWFLYKEIKYYRGGNMCSRLHS